MQNRISRTEYRHTVVCVDSYENNIMQGRIFSPYISDQNSFYGLMDLILKVENLLGRMHLPGEDGSVRKFGFWQEEEADKRLPEPQRRAGGMGTFVIRILFRQNSSWQGSILWMEGKMEQSFRSLLELVLLMNHALNAGRGEAS